MLALLCGLAGSGCLGQTDDDDTSIDDDDTTANDDDTTANDDDATADDDDATADDDDDDATADDDDSAGDDDDDATADDDDSAGDDDDSAPPVPTLPLALTDWYSITGYFSEWNSGDLWTTILESETPGTCAVRGGAARGDCLQVTYNRDPDGDGAGPNFSGFFWQYPASNWGQDDDGDGLPDLGPGLAIPSGATSVSFYAWGAAGGEQVNFKTGINAADGFEIATGNQTLTTTPTQYTIDVSTSGYTTVTGGFAWIMEWNVAPLNNTEWTFYLDDLVWE